MNNYITDKEQFIMTASDFFNEIFEPAFNSECGYIEIRTFKPATQNFFKSEMHISYFKMILMFILALIPE